MVHKFKQLGYNIVLDSDSNGVHVLDDCAYDMLDFISAPMSEEMPVELLEKLNKYPEEDIRGLMRNYTLCIRKARYLPRTITKSIRIRW